MQHSISIHSDLKEGNSYL